MKKSRSAIDSSSIYPANPNVNPPVDHLILMNRALPAKYQFYFSTGGVVDIVFKGLLSKIYSQASNRLYNAHGMFILRRSTAS
jgi:hypothetical protein